MKTRTLLVLTFAAALPLAAQVKKPAPAKPVTPAKPSAEQKTIDKAKQEIRNIKGLKDAEARLKKARSNIAAAEKEDARLNKEGLPSTEDAEAKLERLKNSTSEEDLKEFESLLQELKQSKPAMEEELKKWKQRLQDKIKKEGPSVPSPNPAPAPDPAPGGFDKNVAPVPQPLQKGPGFRPPPIKADRMIKGPSRDPKNPDIELPDSDQRTRTYVLIGTVTLRQPTMALDADEVDLLFKAGQAPGSDGAGKKGSPPAADPIGRPKKQGSDIERIVARHRVRLMFVDKNGLVQVGRGDQITFEESTGWFSIKGWPEVEFDGKLFRGPTKDSVIRLSRLEEADVRGCAFFYLDRTLTAEDLPKTPDKPVPAAGPIRADSAAPPASAPSPKPR